MSSLRWTDEDLLRELGGALREAPADGRIITAAEAAFSWRTADEELELLLLEPEASLGALAGAVRGAGPAAPRTLTFRGEQLSVEIEIDDNGIVGQLIPPQPGQVRLVTSDGPQAAAQADEVGCFTLPLPPPGPMRLDCELNGNRFVTEWTAG
ncbi:MAG TPA: hypothetical protein VNH17_22755 [Streptosporangiaceae bacterium]|nr:hypothetical protein [Streptosporangiaceae bacterium]